MYLCMYVRVYVCVCTHARFYACVCVFSAVCECECGTVSLAVSGVRVCARACICVCTAAERGREGFCAQSNLLMQQNQLAVAGPRYGIALHPQRGLSPTHHSGECVLSDESTLRQVFEGVPLPSPQGGFVPHKIRLTVLRSVEPAAKQ